MKINDTCIKILGISIAVIIYAIFIVIPFASEYIIPPTYLPILVCPIETIIYFFMTTPVFLGYLIYVSINFKNIKCLRFILYPLIIFILYCGAFACLIVMSPLILWMAVATIFIFVIAIPALFIIGLVLDIKESINHNKDDNL